MPCEFEKYRAIRLPRKSTLELLERSVIKSGPYSHISTMLA